MRDRAPLQLAREVAGPDDREDVLNALRRLPARQRECLVLRYYNDLSEADIAESLGISPGSERRCGSSYATR